MYLVYAHLPALDFTRPYAARAVAIIQPILIFAMLFLAFCKVDVRQLRPRITHLWLLLIQCGSFALLALLIHFLPNLPGRVLVEAAMLCMICPTATAATVVTYKLGGDSTDITMYTLLINLCVSLCVPLFVPLVHPHAELSFLPALMRILSKVFPMLICPLIAACLVRYLTPKLHQYLLRYRDLPFYLWAVALSIAIAVTVRSLAHTHESMPFIIGIAAVSLATCILQFGVGRKIGKKYGLPISTCQGLGQKNTVFAIWMGYTFMDPVTSIAGGFYSIWHNLYNTYQLRKTGQ